MTVNPARIRARRGRIEERPQPPTAQPLPTNFTGNPGTISVVIRSTREEIDNGGAIMVQRVQYRTNPPVPGDYGPVGEPFVGHPIHGSVPELYARLAWGPGAWGGSDGLLPYPLLAHQDNGAWILQIPIKGVATEINPNNPGSGCSG